MRTRRLTGILAAAIPLLVLAAGLAAWDWYPSLKALGRMRRERSEWERKTREHQLLAARFNVDWLWLRYGDEAHHERRSHDPLAERRRLLIEDIRSNELRLRRAGREGQRQQRSGSAEADIGQPGLSLGRIG